MAMVEDFTAFMSTDDFAVNAMLGWDAVKVIFDNGNALAAVGPFGMASTQPTALLATSLVPASVVNMVLDVGDVRYTVVAHEPDGTGMSRLLLEAA